MSEEKLPVSDFYKVLDYTTIEKNPIWWSAVILLDNRGRKQIGVYLWHKRGEKWIRKGKFTIRNEAQWEKIEDAIDKLVSKL